MAEQETDKPAVKKEASELDAKVGTTTFAGTAADSLDAQSLAYVAPVSPQVTYGGQAPLSLTTSSSLTDSAWHDELDRAKHRPWNSSLGGRLGIRTVSRGLLGATFFALGTHYARSSLTDYRPGMIPQKPLHYVAAGIDRFIGAPLEKVMSSMYGKEFAKEFVTFRPTKFHYKDTISGATLGHEAVAITFDFASMSVGDGIGRDLAEAVDPNVHHSWIDDDGHINYSQVGKNIVKNSVKYVTYSAGEDMAVAIPYAFFCKAQRNVIDKVSPGFGYDSDRRLNGGSFKVNSSGNITGTYGLEGDMDLQGRFTGYNIGTLMYRESYMEAKNMFKRWSQSGFQVPRGPDNIGDAISDSIAAVGNFSRWAMRDAVKATLYMTPAVPAFWMFRVPQSKFKGAFIHPEKGLIGFGSSNTSLQVVRANEITRSTNHYRSAELKFSEHTPTHFRSSDEYRKAVYHGPVENPFVTYGVRSPQGEVKIDAYEHTYGVFDKALNPLGKFNNKVRKQFHHPIHELRNRFALNIDTEKLRAKNLSDAFVNASFAYTPYFMMKNDVMAYNWDTAKMDMAIERAIDGVTHLKPGEITEGVKEVWASMWHKPFKDPVREIAAQKAICDDDSPADGQNFYANSRCFDSAMQNITISSAYNRDADTKRLVERLKDSRERSSGLMNQFKEEASQSFADRVQPRSMQEKAWNTPDPDLSYAGREKQRQASSLDDYPDINTTFH